MKYKNSFFRLETKNGCTYLDLFPAQNDGKQLELTEIIHFIDGLGTLEYSADIVKKSLAMLKDKPVQVKLSDSEIATYNEKAIINVSNDRMVAYIRFYPPSNGGSLMTKKEILAELQREKITYGILENVIDVFLQARQYCLNIPIARGKAPIKATDTVIEYFFNTKPLAKPKMLEDGSVDFHELSLFTKTNKGDVLAKLTPHSMGEPGKDIYGNAIQQNKPKIKTLKYGKNITLSDDKTTLTSNVNGNVTLTGDTVFVSDTYNVAADVDASTGDIDYDGNVLVAGNVRTGFTVKAKGDIQVNGVVEGATLIAGGNIVIKRGVQGMAKGHLEADGDICAQFFESSDVEAKGDVIAGSVLHSNIIAGGKLVVSGKKGFIVGGEIICGNLVEVNTIGNKMETQTMIKVGVNPELYAEMKELVTAVNGINEQLTELESYLNVYKDKLKKGIKLSPENIKNIKEYNAKIEPLKEEKRVKKERLVEIKSVLDTGKKGMVKVYGTSYRGVTIFISSAIYNVKEQSAHCIYKISDGKIVSVSF
ncbi:MAG: FapA family protein [Wujia sp.]